MRMAVNSANTRGLNRARSVGNETRVTTSL